MHNSKLLEIISKFDNSEINQFLEYLQIYRHKSENNTIKLFDIIYNAFPNLDSVELSKEKAHQILFPDKKYDDKRILNIMSDLLNWTEEFIIYQGNKKNEIANNFHLLEFYLEHNLNKHFENIYKKTLELINKNKEDATILYANYKIEEIYIRYQLKYNNRYSNYQPLYNALNSWKISQETKLNNLCLINLFNDIENNRIESVLAKIQLEINQLLHQPNDELYNNIKYKIFNDIKTKISQTELRTILILLIGFVIIKINEGNENYYQELLDLYNLMIEENILLESNHKISPAIIKNYITISTRLGKIDEADVFLEKYKEDIDENDFEDIYNLNKANILFEQKKYEDALHLLITIKYKDIFYKVNAKRLYLKIYYELSVANQKKYFDVLESAMNAFKKYIYTTKELIEDFQERNKNFYKYLNKIIQYSFFDDKKLTLLKKEIEQDTKCIDKDWLLKKIEE